MVLSAIQTSISNAGQAIYDTGSSILKNAEDQFQEWINVGADQPMNPVAAILTAAAGTATAISGMKALETVAQMIKQGHASGALANRSLVQFFGWSTLTAISCLAIHKCAQELRNVM